MKLFSINLVTAPISVAIIKCEELTRMEASRVLFTHDGCYLVIGTHRGSVHLFDIESLKLVHTFEHSLSKITTLNISENCEWLVVGSGAFLKSYSLNRRLEHQVLPTYALATSVTFEPKTDNLVITTVENGIYILDIPSNSLTPWSRKNSHNLPMRFTSRSELINGVNFVKGKMMLWGGSYIYPIDMNLDLERDSKWDLVHRFQSLMFCETLIGENGEKDELVLVERPVLQVLAELPDAFKKRKYYE